MTDKTEDVAIFIVIVYVKQQQSKLKRFEKKVNIILFYKSLHMDETRLFKRSAC